MNPLGQRDRAFDDDASLKNDSADPFGHRKEILSAQIQLQNRPSPVYTEAARIGMDPLTKH